MSPNKTFNDYIFKDILNTIGPAVMGVKKTKKILEKLTTREF